MKKLLTLAVLLVFLAVPAAYPCTSIGCPNHKHLVGDYPYTEDFGKTNVYYGSSYVTVIEGCAGHNYKNFRHPQAATNAVLRALVNVEAATAPPGSRFAIRFLLNNVPQGEYVRTLRGQYPQNEDINGVSLNWPPGEHELRVQVWLVDGQAGQYMEVGGFLIAQGVPTTYPANWAVSSAH